MILELLVLRKADTSELQHRIENCSDPATLERWFHILASSRPDVRLSDIFT